MPLAFRQILCAVGSNSGSGHANFERHLEAGKYQIGCPANLAGFRASPTIIVHDGKDEDKIIKEMEARGEFPPPENFPAGRIRVIE